MFQQTENTLKVLIDMEYNTMDEKTTTTIPERKKKRILIYCSSFFFALVFIAFYALLCISEYV